MRAMVGVCCVLVGCTVESGGEQAPVFEGSGVLIAAGDEGRTISVDVTHVPWVASCEANQLLVRTTDGWECRSPDASLEADPTVNTLGKASLSCDDGDVAQHDGAAWTCVQRLTEAAVDTLVANNGYATGADVTALEAEDNGLDARIDALEALDLSTRVNELEDWVTTLQDQVADLQTNVNALFPTYFLEGFDSGSTPGNADQPSSSVWQNPDNTPLTASFAVSSGGVERTSGVMGQECMAAVQTSTAQTNSALAPRLRYSVLIQRPPGPGSQRVSVSFNQDVAGGGCNDSGVGLGIELNGTGSDMIRAPGAAMAWTNWGSPPGNFVDNTEYFVQATLSGSTFAFNICTVAYCGETGAVAFASGSVNGVMAPFGSRTYMMIEDSTGNRIRVNHIQVSVPKPAP
jgi:hypothetical protein